jgi:hypothetical protein
MSTGGQACSARRQSQFCGGRVALAALAATALALTGCARAMSVTADPRPVHRITVQNEFAEAMIVSYDDGRGDALLGMVPAGQTEHFVIASQAGSVTVSARNAAGSRTAGPYTVHLAPDTPQIVRLVPGTRNSEKPYSDMNLLHVDVPGRQPASAGRAVPQGLQGNLA